MRWLNEYGDEIALLVLCVLFIVLGFVAAHTQGQTPIVRKVANLSSFTTHEAIPITYEASKYEFLRVRLPSEYARVEMWTTSSTSANAYSPYPWSLIGENPMKTFWYTQYHDDIASVIIPVQRGDAHLRVMLYMHNSEPGICGVPWCGSVIIQPRIDLSQIPYERRRAVQTNEKLYTLEDVMW